jgi:CubicO group peptidase (beta-lactamase class C family)
MNDIVTDLFVNGYELTCTCGPMKRDLKGDLFSLWSNKHMFSETRRQAVCFMISMIVFYGFMLGSVDAAQWQARHGLTSEQYQATFDDLANQGYRLVQISGYSVNNEARYAAIWELSTGPAWQARHGLTSEQYQATFDDLANQGYRLVQVSGYSVDNEARYAAIWEQNEEGELPPITGAPVPELAIFDQVMQQFMADRHIQAGSLAIMKDGAVVFERGYGWLDQDQTTLLPPDALFRLASVVKPITAAAIRQLIDQGLLNPDDRVFCLPRSTSNCLLNISPFGTPDARAADITVQHLLDHKGGFDRDISGDPMFQSMTIANQLGIASPPEKLDIARYMLGRPLDHTPGTVYAYSNFGYMLLGLIIEDITGLSYTDHIQQTIFAPLGIPSSEIELGRSLPTFRNPREPWYSDPGTTSSVFDPALTVPWPDGGFYLEAMEAHGGLIASTNAILHFLQAFWISGEPRMTNDRDYWFFGSLPGTHTLARQRSDGVNIVALFNQRADSSGLDYDIIKQLLDDATDSVAVWPN